MTYALGIVKAFAQAVLVAWFVLAAVRLSADRQAGVVAFQLESAAAACGRWSPWAPSVISAEVG